MPEPKAFYVEDCQIDSETFNKKTNRVFVGIDETTGFFTVEGSKKLYDELFVVRGLDDKDLQNYIMVAEYVLAANK